MGAQYRYSIENQDGDWYYEDGINIGIQSTVFHFYGKVASWATLGLRDSRNMRMGGFFRNRSSEVQFVLTLAKVMRHAKYKKGVNQVLTLHIDRWDSTTYEYLPDGKSEINLAQSRDEKNQFAAYMAEAGAPELIKTREDTKYSFEVSGSDAVSVKVLPQLVKGYSSFISVTPEDESVVTPNRSTDKYNMLGYAQHKETVFEILDSPNFRPVDYFDVMATNLAMSGGASTSMELGQPYQERDKSGTTSDFSLFGIVKIVNTTSEIVDYLIKTNVALESVSLKGSINVYLKNVHATDPATFKIKYYTQPLTGGAVTSVGNGSNTVTVLAGASGTSTFTFDETEFSIAAESVLYITLENTTANLSVEWMFEGGMPLIAEFTHRTTEYTTTGFNTYTLLAKIVDRITDGAVTFDSTLLSNAITYLKGSDCRPDKLLITSTQCLQGKTSPVINISLKELLTSLSVWVGCGLTILRDLVTGDYSQVRIEDWNYFYQALKPDLSENTIAEFDTVSDWYIEPAEEMIFSELRIGYDPADIDEVNIVDDVHVTHRYTSQYTKRENIMEMISPIAASGFAMYKEVFAAFGTQYSTSQSTNRNFVIQYNPVQVAGVHTALYSTDINPTPYQTGITDPTRLLNPGLTPKHLVIRSAYYILSHMPYVEDIITDNYLLTFQSTDRNSSYKCKLATLFVVSQNSDIDIADTVTWLGQNRLFYPEYLYHTAPSKRNYKAAWEANRFGVFNVTIPLNAYSSPVLKVFPVESADWTAKNDTYDFKGLLTAGNDLGDLVR